MKLSLKDAADLNTAVTYIKSQTDIDTIHSYLNFMPIKGIALLKVLNTSDELTNKNATFLPQDLELLLVSKFESLTIKHLRDLDTMYKTVLGLQKQNKFDDARTVVTLMVKQRNHLGALTIRVLKQISNDWRTFFVKTLPALKKQYL